DPTDPTDPKDPSGGAGDGESIDLASLLGPADGKGTPMSDEEFRKLRDQVRAELGPHPADDLPG
ncbi:MAG: hypothetical protein KDC46_05655, partial [Thermoleophilia bacterium]|nr:hypothetical protein [Thermoleophilia bacterium]